jgi:N utilization substance protein B
LSARSKARKRALDILYASDMRHRSALEALQQQREEGPVNDYTVELVGGVTDHAARLDEVISSYAQGWTLERMPAVDRNVLRLATYEVLFVDDVPDAVAVSEALNLVRDLSTDESPAFVNGVLGNIVRDRESLAG